MEASSGDVPNSVPPLQAESSDNFDGGKDLASSIKDKLSNLHLNKLNYGTICIYKVPEKLRRKNEEAYAPRLVSIGLVHYGESQLQAMEEYKLKYLAQFLHTFRVSLVKLADYVGAHEKSVYGCYEDIYLVKLSKVKPSEVILLDGIFILQLFLRNHFPKMREKGDIIFNIPSVSNDILHDLLLFENQLPLWFLYKMYDNFVLNHVRKSLDDDSVYYPSFHKLVHKYFRNVASTEKLLLHDFSNTRHLVEFLSVLHTPKPVPDAIGKRSVENKSDFSKCPTTAELVAAGVKFRQGEGKCLLNVDFDNSNGVFTIPPLTVSDSTETFFHNQIAYERSVYGIRHITSYAILLGNLLKTHKDVDLLIQSKIIRNEFGSSEKVAELFSNLYKDLVVDPDDFHFVEMCRLLNGYSRDLWHKCKVFISKRLTASISIVAIIVFVLTVVQAVCSVLQVM